MQPVNDHWCLEMIIATTQGIDLSVYQLDFRLLWANMITTASIVL